MVDFGFFRTVLILPTGACPMFPPQVLLRLTPRDTATPTNIGITPTIPPTVDANLRLSYLPKASPTIVVVTPDNSAPFLPAVLNKLFL
jgi:hypothetical protein